MSDATWKTQASVKTPSGTLVNVRADDGPELLQIIEFLVANADKIAGLESALGGVVNVAQGLGGTVVEHHATPPVNPQPSWQGSSSPAPQVSAAPAGGAPIDKFGKPMVYKTGISKKTGKEWKAWMGDYPQGDAQGAQVEVQWIR